MDNSKSTPIGEEKGEEWVHLNRNLNEIGCSNVKINDIPVHQPQNSNPYAPTVPPHAGWNPIPNSGEMAPPLPIHQVSPAPGFVNQPQTMDPHVVPQHAAPTLIFNTGGVTASAISVPVHETPNPSSYPPVPPRAGWSPIPNTGGVTPSLSIGQQSVTPVPVHQPPNPSSCPPAPPLPAAPTPTPHSEITPIHALPNGGHSPIPVCFQYGSPSQAPPVGGTSVAPSKSKHQQLMDYAKNKLPFLNKGKKNNAPVVQTPPPRPPPIVNEKVEVKSEKPVLSADDILGESVDEMLRRMEEKDRAESEKLRREQQEKSRRETERLMEEILSTTERDGKILGEIKERHRSELEARREMLHKKMLDNTKRAMEEIKKDEQNFAKEMLDMEKIREKEKNEFNADLQSADEKLAEKLHDHQKIMDQKEEEIHRDKLLFDEQLEKIRLEAHEKQRESEEMWEEKTRRMKEQSERLHELLKYRVWNEVIERNWTNKLNVCRSATKQIVKEFPSFKTAVMKLTQSIRQSETKSTIEHHKNLLMLRIETLLKATRSADQFLKSEIHNLQGMYDETGKNFLITIIDSIERIHRRCKELVHYLEASHHELEKANVSNRIMDYERSTYQLVLESFRNLEKDSRNVPTLAELKRKYHEEMKEQSGTGNESNYNDADFEQSVLIEEIELRNFRSKRERQDRAIQASHRLGSTY